MLHCGLLGERLRHSYSPRIYRLLGDFSYELFERSPSEVDAFIHGCCLDGLNITIPYKKTVLKWCDTLSPEAAAIGSVNTLLFKDGKRIGCNTDAYGFSALLRKYAIAPAGKKVLILGNGGASATVQYVLSRLGAEPLVISRNGENDYKSLSRHTDAKILVNTTPVGMYPDNGCSVLDVQCFSACECVVDLIYNPSRTKLLLDAECLGIPAFNGLYMLVAQAKRAAELYMQTTLPDERMDEIANTIAKAEQNIVLIGMPGCGKSCIGRLLSQLTGRDFIDTDAELERVYAKPAHELLLREGEGEFRRREAAVLREVCKLSGKVIATGGGAVTLEENYNSLRQNGALVFLDRPLNELQTEGRPLSEQQGVEVLAQQRMPLYRSWADISVAVTSPEAAADAILKELEIP